MDESRRWQLRASPTYEDDVRLAFEYLLALRARQRWHADHPGGRRRKTDPIPVMRPVTLSCTPAPPPLSGKFYRGPNYRGPVAR